MNMSIGGYGNGIHSPGGFWLEVMRGNRNLKNLRGESIFLWSF